MGQVLYLVVVDTQAVGLLVEEGASARGAERIRAEIEEIALRVELDQRNRAAADVDDVLGAGKDAAYGLHLRVHEVHWHEIQSAGDLRGIGAGYSSRNRAVQVQPGKLLPDYVHWIAVVSSGRAMQDSALRIHYDDLNEDPAYVESNQRVCSLHAVFRKRLLRKAQTFLPPRRRKTTSYARHCN